MPIVAAFERIGKVRHVKADRPIGEYLALCMCVRRCVWMYTRLVRFKSKHGIIHLNPTHTPTHKNNADQVYADVRKAMLPLEKEFESLL
jgi:hypothetical protein